MQALLLSYNKPMCRILLKDIVREKIERKLHVCISLSFLFGLHDKQGLTSMWSVFVR